jgi:hypothetical protein
LPSTYKALGSIPNTGKKKKRGWRGKHEKSFKKGKEAGRKDGSFVRKGNTNLL